MQHVQNFMSCVCTAAQQAELRSENVKIVDHKGGASEHMKKKFDQLTDISCVTKGAEFIAVRIVEFVSIIKPVLVLYRSHPRVCLL
jgi:hypothetical protein